MESHAVSGIPRREQLLAVAVTDICPNGVSAVYTFFDPGEETRSLGTFAILQQVELAAAAACHGCTSVSGSTVTPKMDYKRRFKPLQIRTAAGWTTLASQATTATR